MTNFLFKRVDNSVLVVFRIFFGLLIFLESAGAIATGWVRRVLVEPQFTFSFIGFEWLQPLPYPGMYLWFGLMALMGLGIMFGYRYKLSLAVFTVLWVGVYLMQKSSYNNHYYLLILVCLLMLAVPAHAFASIDSKRNPSIKSNSMPAWARYIFILQLFIVYTYAAVAKIYPDWMDHTVTEILLSSKKNSAIIGGNWLTWPILHQFVGWAGIFFDGLVVPALLWKPTRKFAILTSFVFHLFNSFIFQIGIFPYLALAFLLFFVDPKWVQKTFLPKKTFYSQSEVAIPPLKNWALAIASVFFILQISLPLRHWFIKGDVLFTEEGHRLSWRMMLRTKSGHVQFKVADRQTNKTTVVNPSQWLNPKQRRSMASHPDMIWQFSRFLQKKYAVQGQDVAVYAIARISVNGRKSETFIDPTVDLTQVKWNPWKHHSWIVLNEAPEKNRN